MTTNLPSSFELKKPLVLQEAENDFYKQASPNFRASSTSGLLEAIN
jgi:hypothetical protein